MEIILSQIIGFVINGAILIAGLIAINKVPFFTKNLNEKKIKGKKLARLGWICFFGYRCVSLLVYVCINCIAFSGGVVAQGVFNVLRIVGYLEYIGIAILVYSAILLYQSSKAEPENDENKDKPKTPVFTANEEMSQKAQYAYTSFRNEYEQGVGTLDEAAEAKMFAKAVELQLLKTPASAVFCAMEEITALPIGEGAYAVSGYVDSQNSYGAMLRSQFNLTVFKDENGIWKNANKFISTAASVNGSIVSHTILWWVLGIIGTIITLAISYAFSSSMF